VAADAAFAAAAMIFFAAYADSDYFAASHYAGFRHCQAAIDTFHAMISLRQPLLAFLHIFSCR